MTNSVFSQFGFELGLVIGLGLGLEFGIGLRFGLGLGLGLFWDLRQNSCQTILPTNGKIIWGYFASRGKLATDIS